jgi:thiol-disulfide isomerase/thioredoxin
MKEIKFFYTEWCKHCKKMLPEMKNLSESGYNVKLIDADDNTSLANNYNIKRIPTFIFEDKGFEIQRWEGRTEPYEVITKLTKTKK